MRSIVSRTAGALFAVLLAGNAPATEVMIVGTYHMSNPGRDLHNVKADDVLLPKRQRDLDAVSGALAKFRPTLVVVESPAKNGAAAPVEKYRMYLDGSLPDSRNEVVQVGFRLARAMHLADVWGIDIEGDFPYEPVKQFAEAHGPALHDRLDAMGASVERMLDGLNRVLKNGSIGQGLRYMNDPRRITEGHEFYRTMLLFGQGTQQPGAALLDAWESRNNAICARLVQLARKNDRVVVIYGAGHSYLLRQCVLEMPGFKLIEANDYLPK